MAGPAHAIDWITLRSRPVLCVAALLLITTAAFVPAWRSSSRPIYIFCAVWFVITIAPALNLNALWWLVDDRYLYAPSFGFWLAAGVALVGLSEVGSEAQGGRGSACGIPGCQRDLDDADRALLARRRDILRAMRRDRPLCRRLSPQAGRFAEQGGRSRGRRSHSRGRDLVQSRRCAHASDARPPVSDDGSRDGF